MDNGLNNQNPYMNQNTQQVNAQLPNNGNVPGYMLWLLLGIAQILTLCCCNCITFIFGILTVVFACIANNQFKQGNIIMSTANIKKAKIFNILGWLLIIVNFVINLLLGVFEYIGNYITQ